MRSTPTDSVSTRLKLLVCLASTVNKQRIENFQNEVLTESNRETEKLVGAYIDTTTLKDDPLRGKLMEDIRDAIY